MKKSMKKFKYTIPYNNINHRLIRRTFKMNIESLKIKTKTNYNWDDIVYINDFDVNSLEIIKRESRIGANILYWICS